jgi:hypothetical protein
VDGVDDKVTGLTNFPSRRDADNSYEQQLIPPPPFWRSCLSRWSDGCKRPELGLKKGAIEGAGDPLSGMSGSGFGTSKFLVTPPTPSPFRQWNPLLLWIRPAMLAPQDRGGCLDGRLILGEHLTLSIAYSNVQQLLSSCIFQESSDTHLVDTWAEMQDSIQGFLTSNRLWDCLSPLPVDSGFILNLKLKLIYYKNSNEMVSR